MLKRYSDQAMMESSKRAENLAAKGTPSVLQSGTGLSMLLGNLPTGMR
jgi:hypothetical protein